MFGSIPTEKCEVGIVGFMFCDKPIDHLMLETEVFENRRNQTKFLVKTECPAWPLPTGVFSPLLLCQWYSLLFSSTRHMSFPLHGGAKVSSSFGCAWRQDPLEQAKFLEW